MSVVFCFFLIYACGDDIVEPPKPRVKIEDRIATVVKMPNGTSCDYLILYNSYFFPSNLPDSLKEPNLDVVVTFEFTEENHTCIYDDGTTVESQDFQIIDILEIRKQ
jgi:hypothetical protein